MVPAQLPLEDSLRVDLCLNLSCVTVESYLTSPPESQVAVHKEEEEEEECPLS